MVDSQKKSPAKPRVKKSDTSKVVHVDAHERKVPAPKPKEKVKPKFNNEPRTNFD